MKFIFTLFSLLSLFFSINAQTTFSDDFESYTNGAYIAASNSKWSTWSKKPGTDEDAKVTNEKSKSGQLALKIINTVAAGGATDLILPFGGKYTTGNFKYKMSMFIPTGKNAYFNFQATQTVGQTWALDANFTENGLMVLARSSATLLSAPVPMNEWFELEFDINLTLNLWKVKVNGNCLGAFSNGTNSISSIDFFPTNTASLYYVDDVSFEYTTTAPKFQFDGGISDFTWTKGKLAGIKEIPEITFRNYGDSVITSVDLLINTDGISQKENIGNLSLAKGKSIKLNLPEITLKSGINNFSVGIEKINGKSGDEELCNNNINFTQNAVTAAPNKAVLVEEGTGTWCQWCPRGAVFMDKYNEQYHKLFIPIAVHNGSTDPMLLPEYDNFMDFSAYPNCKVNRGVVLDPDASETPFLQEIVKETPIKIYTGAKYSEVTKTLNVSAEIEFLDDAEGQFYVSLVLTEDEVTGTTSGYNQSNAYAGGGSGVMGGYELLPSPVPAAKMVYDHVARAVSGLNPNTNNSFSGSYSKGDKVLKNFEFVLANTWEADKMNIIPIVLNGTTYVNAATSTIAEAIAQGFVIGTENQILNTNQVSIYPNPATEMTNLSIHLTKPSEVGVTLYHSSGQIIKDKNYGVLTGDYILPLELGDLNAGVYMMKIKTNQGTRMEKIIIQ